MIEEALSLYLVTNRDGLTEEQFLETIIEACEGGVTMVQLREKEASTHDFYELALKVKKITDHYLVPLIINDRVDICLAVDADGVHIGDSELPVSKTRELIGPNKLLGVSTKTVTRGIDAKFEGADYLGVGAIYPTTTKVQTKLTSMETLTQIIKETKLPTVAIGGIKEENILSFKEAPISGVAIVSDIMQAQNVPEKVAKLRELVDDVKGER
ncbi:thiamine phosphate synthase [Vagococcus sp. DIV0080]|uniref:Thiamine-phosphate synthase n=1 Tax=Candidatus Vagococcus giribetii TaxID=2230876 RepID=A0ABS3HVM2_9ENTE|nr:thiamine phosphate synthase [Vagococcus sp. DIV0080]MBO0477809.1 thiamine phosphate synthase [Vagococcus sp. DIV0080]